MITFRKGRFGAISVVLLLVASACAKSTSVEATHPIIGTWDFKALGSGCLESSDYKTDGTGVFVSAAEQGKTRYEVSPAASPAGFYKLVDTIVENNGQPSCSGRVIPVGQKVTVYLKFEDSQREMRLCTAESEQSCVVKFVRRASSSG